MEKHDADGNTRFPHIEIQLGWNGRLLSMTIDGEEVPWMTSLQLKTAPDDITQVVIGIPAETVRVSGPAQVVAHLQPLSDQIDLVPVLPDLSDCPGCSRGLLPESRFCSHCGVAVPPDRR